MVVQYPTQAATSAGSYWPHTASTSWPCSQAGLWEEQGCEDQPEKNPCPLLLLLCLTITELLLQCLLPRAQVKWFLLAEGKETEGSPRCPQAPQFPPQWAEPILSSSACASSPLGCLGHSMDETCAAPCLMEWTPFTDISPAVSLGQSQRSCTSSSREPVFAMLASWAECNTAAEPLETALQVSLTLLLPRGLADECSVARLKCTATLTQRLRDAARGSQQLRVRKGF